MPRLRQVSDDGMSRCRFSPSDVFWALFMIAWITFGTVAIGHDVEEYRWQRRAIAEFSARMPHQIVAVPYDPAVRERLIGEAVGCVLTILMLTIGIRRRGAVQARVKWIAAQPSRIVPVQAARSHAPVSAPAIDAVAGPARKENSGSVAADRLSAVIWYDHAARLEKERV